MLDSLYKSGLATSVVKDILTNSDYIPFATDLIKAMIANNLIDLGNIVDAVKQSGLVTQLFQKLVNFGTVQTVAETAFAAYAGECQGSGAFWWIWIRFRFRFRIWIWIWYYYNYNWWFL